MPWSCEAFVFMPFVAGIETVVVSLEVEQPERPEEGESAQEDQPQEDISEKDLVLSTDNNKAEDIAAGITAICKKIRQKLPRTKIVLFGIFPRGEMPNDMRKLNANATGAVPTT